MAFALLVFSALLEFWHIVVLVIFMAIVSSFSTAAQQVLVVSLVPQEGVVSALALHSATHNLTKVIGPSLGGLLLTLIGPGPCLLIQAGHEPFFRSRLWLPRSDLYRQRRGIATGSRGRCCHRAGLWPYLAGVAHGGKGRNIIR